MERLKALRPQFPVTQLSILHAPQACLIYIAFEAVLMTAAVGSHSGSTEAVAVAVAITLATIAVALALRS